MIEGIWKIGFSNLRKTKKGIRVLDLYLTVSCLFKTFDTIKNRSCSTDGKSSDVPDDLWKWCAIMMCK